MLENTFIHIPGIGPRRERLLHESGLTSWSEFLADPGKCGLPTSLIAPAVNILQESTYRLESRDAAFFDRMLPSSERWRIYGDFAHECAFLDIETTGMNPPADYVTVAGLHDARGTHSFVRGENLFMLPEKLSRYKLIVTFNGAQFDLPFLKSHMGNIFGQHAHIDLRFVLRRLGFSGGLKSIERQLGISRAHEVQGMDGFEAVMLWYRYLEGDNKSLDKLISYNSEDVRNLKPLMKLAFDKLASMFMENTKNKGRTNKGAAF